LALTQSLLGNFQEARDAAVRLTEEFPDYPISPAIEDLLD
jgi:hypothetical protein